VKNTTVLSVLLSTILLGTLLLFANFPIAKSANFVGRTIYIRADGSIDPADAPVDVHGTIYTLTGDIQCPRTGYCIYINRSGILLDGYGYTIEGWNPQDESSVPGLGIYLGFVDDVEIRNITIRGCAGGIAANSVSATSIHNITVDGNYLPMTYEAIAIDLLQSDGVNVDHNRLVNNYMGILVQSSNSTITNNSILDNSGVGIYLGGPGISVVSNIIARNDLGIEITSNDNLIKTNEILKNKRLGVLLSGTNNTLIENNIEDHTNSTQGYGIQMDPSALNNTFYHNDFENNIIHVTWSGPSVRTSSWDNGYPSGGNYWDTYDGSDAFTGLYQNETGSDNIGDTPYQITEVDTDYYPLKTPFRPTPDIGEATTTQNGNTLGIIVAVIIAAGTIAAVFLLYWRRKNKQITRESLARLPEGALLGRLVLPVLLALSMMIILNLASISAGIYGLGTVELFGGALYFDEIPMGFISSAVGVFITWKIIIKHYYKNGRLEEILVAVLTSFLFVACLLAYTAYYPFGLFGLLQYTQPTLVLGWTFATTLIGCYLGFLLGGVGLEIYIFRC
jgi:parallel beta-helix repeat protein